MVTEIEDRNGFVNTGEQLAHLSFHSSRAEPDTLPGRCSFQSKFDLVRDAFAARPRIRNLRQWHRSGKVAI